MTFLDLPTELLLLVLQESRSRGFEALSLSCKRLYGIGKSFFEEHNRFKKSYVSLDLGISLEPNESCLEILRKAMLDPMVARYPRFLQLHNQNMRGTNHDPTLRYSALQTMISRFVHDSPYLSRERLGDDSFISFFYGRNTSGLDPDLGKWRDYMVTNFPECLTAILLLILPNLEGITFIDV